MKTFLDFIRFFWHGLDLARRIAVNVLFLALLVALIGWLIADETPEVPETTALVVAPYGSLVEELSGETNENALLALLGEERPETLLRPLLEAIETAKDDDRVQVLVLDTDRLGRAGPRPTGRSSGGGRRSGRVRRQPRWVGTRDPAEAVSSRAGSPPRTGGTKSRQRDRPSCRRGSRAQQPA